MKKYSILLLTAIMVFAVVSCNGDKKAVEENVSDEAEKTERKVQVVETENSLINKIIIVADVYEYKERIEMNEAVIVDVRTPDEYGNGKIANASNVDFLSDNFEEQIGVYDRETVIHIYCQSGNRSGKAALVMKKMGFKKIYDLDGGYGKWESMGF